MKKLICLITALLMCMMVTVPAFAAQDDFVDSIEIKDAPEVEDAVVGGESVGSAMVVTSILQAMEQSTGITQEERDHLLEVYEAVNTNKVQPPVEHEDYVITSMVDVSFVGTDLEENLEEGKAGVTVTFNLGVQAVTTVEVFTYVNGQWFAASNVVNNGDGTITATLDYLGVVAFCMDASGEALPPATGDLAIGDIALWGGMLVVSGAMLVCVILMRRKTSEK